MWWMQTDDDIRENFFTQNTRLKVESKQIIAE